MLADMLSFIFQSDFYRALLLKSRGKHVEGIFATQNEMIHRNLKRPISNTYSMSHLLSFEPYVNTTMRMFLEQLEARFVQRKDVGGKNNPCNLSQWLQMFAFDVIGELTFSHAFGFLESGKDIDGAMADLWNTLTKLSLVSASMTISSKFSKEFGLTGADSMNAPGYSNAMARPRLD